MTPSPVSPRLANISLYPIKSLDPMHVKEARMGPGGGLEFDRAWALYSADGQWVNGKRSAAVHLIRAVAARDISSVTLSVPGDRRKIPTKTFAFPGDTAAASKWFSNFFEQPITVRHSPEGFPDDTIANGPTIVSTASLQAVCGLFPGMTSDDARLRFRTTLEIDGDRSAVSPAEVPAFWEDRLCSGEERGGVPSRSGEGNSEGGMLCGPCRVPPREPPAGVIIPGFKKSFSDSRRSHVPGWC